MSRMPLILSLFLLAAPPAAAADPDFIPWDRVLKTYTRGGVVDYARLKNEREDLDEFVRWLSGVKPQEEKAWPREKRLAFWINAYNALTFKLVLDRYPIEGSGWRAWRYPKGSVQLIPGGRSSIMWLAAGRRLTLDELENDVLRGELDEPRIHLAIVCAARSCPPLLGEAWQPDALEAQFEAALRGFLAEPDSLRVEGDTIRLTKIAKWFPRDFDRYADAALQGVPEAYRGWVSFLARGLPEGERKKLETGTYSVDLFDYDWRLNE